MNVGAYLRRRRKMSGTDLFHELARGFIYNAIDEKIDQVVKSITRNNPTRDARELRVWFLMLLEESVRDLLVDERHRDTL